MGIFAHNVSKSFGSPPIQVLENISFQVESGEFLSLTGRSGSGKSTLLYVISSLDSPTSGEVLFDGVNVHKLSEKEIHEFRNQNIGFVFQFHYLIPELSALENVLLPARKFNLQKSKKEEAENLLIGFDLKEKMNRLPSQLSGGEQQRVAIARALLMKPKYLFADEPTGNLDSKNGEIVLEIFRKINQELKTTIVMVTHDKEFASLAQRRIVLKDGKIEESF
ncbi:MAG: ABC transporter ATP-binding protein [Leptospiraceae bacterium]|nr:ABC transporter ATP-binding protein [Leptospiraceae bacterium]